MIAQQLDNAVKAVCPIHGVTIGRPGDRKTWSISFKDEATPEQRAAAAAVIAAFDPTPVAQEPTAEVRIAALEKENAELRSTLVRKGVISLNDMTADKRVS